MSVYLYVKAFMSENSPEFKKHLKAVKFCLENKLSFPKETEDFFRGKVDGGDLDDFCDEDGVCDDAVLHYIKNGLEHPLKFEQINECEIHIKTSDIPSGVEKIIVTME